ncbi:innexin inx2 [Parasteatoda tepidariorum]|uniref:innexin inx2 n=1 Tax=Parasteatoda tepidariorum TaxID=114398 RepID=UPI00077FD5A9|nr:innexin inx2 [Parasteatoda tepidariorum]XP_015920213.1 innexin inx2 [Parasteatoda tepidariorum]XP_015920221.1 innexin inx2 [Parasteatoda tepidariorum]XP_015920230.1 innexin inx2 [Parasteatoda tepidariorum]XP_015920237.1 innexin inx2 [Parasteatoda tepidariorum]XP_015920245.1 innexin inx2 [Parasteatoda tepidariorum]
MDLLSGLKNFFRVDTTTIDNNIFRLHYKVTSAILIAFSMLVTGRQYLGDPIDCIPQKGEIPENMLDTFCWVHTTYSLPDAWHKQVGVDVAYPGVDKYKEGDERVFHAYYQWVCFVLFLQALLFYVPRFFWKAMEGKRIKNLIMGLNCPIVAEETKAANKKLLVDYLVANLNNNNLYFAHYILAEIMNFVNVVGQMFLMDVFLGGEFSKYGTEVLKFTEYDGSIRFDPMVKVFPRVTKCTFHNFGSSGDVQKINTLCILPINIINEKIYIFLWFWFVILAVLSGLVLVYRSVIIFWPESRFFILRSRNRIAEPHCIEAVVRKSKLGDFLVLDLLAKNLDSLHFRDIVREFSTRVGEKHLDYVTC